MKQPKRKTLNRDFHQLVFIDSVHFSNNSIENLAKNLEENDFQNLSEEFNAKVLDLVKKKIFFPYDYWDTFKTFKEGLPCKDKFYNSLTNRAISDKYYEHVLSV